MKTLITVDLEPRMSTNAKSVTLYENEGYFSLVTDCNKPNFDPEEAEKSIDDILEFRLARVIRRQEHMIEKVTNAINSIK